MTADERLARSIRDVLAERDPGPAPERLARRVAAARAEATRRPRLSFGPLFRSAAATAVAAVVIGLAIGMRPDGGLPLPGGSGAAAPPGPPVPGVGLATPAPPVVPVVLLGALLVCGVAVLRKVPVGIHRAAVAAGTLGLAYAYAMTGVQPDLAVMAFGIDGARAIPPDDDGGARYELRLTPDEPYRFIVSVQNRSGHPVTIVGIDQLGPEHGPRTVGLGLQPDANELTYDNAIPFREVTLEPDDYAVLIVLGTAGPCASSTARDGFFTQSSIRLVTRAGGWERHTEVPLNAVSPVDEIAIGFDPDCFISGPDESP